MDGSVGLCKSRFKYCLQQSKTLNQFKLSFYLDHGVVAGEVACCQAAANAGDNEESFASNGASADDDAVSGFRFRRRLLSTLSACPVSC